MTNVNQALVKVLRELVPAPVPTSLRVNADWLAACARAAFGPATLTTELTLAALATDTALTRTDLALLILSGDTSAAAQALARCRDLLARRVLVLVPATLPEHGNDLRALAFQHHASFQGDEALYEVWGYDIRTYKQVPDWLNPKFWANPEMWNKQRW